MISSKYIFRTLLGEISHLNDIYSLEHKFSSSFGNKVFYVYFTPFAHCPNVSQGFCIFKYIKACLSTLNFYLCIVNIIEFYKSLLESAVVTNTLMLVGFDN